MVSYVAVEIGKQIGNQALVMMGAKDFVSGESDLTFKIGRNAEGITHVTVTLCPDDTYTVSTAKRSKNLDVVDCGTVEGVYVEQLHTTIEGLTGLRLSL